MKNRCTWVGDNPLYIKYHDEEWGVPVYDDKVLFEFLVLESAQAGLSWITILKKREGYRKAFKDFNVEKVSKMNAADIQRLKQNREIVRNRLKIESTISNAKVFTEIQKECGSFSNYLWNWVDNMVVNNSHSSTKQIPATTKLSDEIAKDLKRRGIKFFGSTICYAYLQAVGIVNDHTTTCFRYAEIHG